MEILRGFFKNKKTAYNLLTAVIIGVLLLIMGSSLFDKETNQTEKEAKLNTDMKQTETGDEYAKRLEKKLEDTLGQIDGVGKIKIMLTLENGKEIVVDKETNSENEKTIEGTNNKEETNTRQEDKTVILNGYEPLILKEIEPKVKGVIIICQGGENVEIKNSLIRATQALLNIEIHKIEVLKMK